MHKVWDAAICSNYWWLTILARPLDVPLQLQARPVYPVLIRYSPVDKGIAPGIIDWIGRGAGRREWSNPHLAGDIVVSASSLCKGVSASR